MYDGKRSISPANGVRCVIQGRVSVDQAVRILEGKDYLKHVGPALYVIDESNIETFDRGSSLAPDDFRPTFTVD